MGMGMKSLKWEGIGTKNLFPHTSNGKGAAIVEAMYESQTVAASLGLYLNRSVANVLHCDKNEAHTSTTCVSQCYRT